MKSNKNLIKCLELILFIFCLALPSVISAASMTDYCARPPFIESAIPPNLLLTIDNSGSMWDLQYVDQGRNVCSTSSTTICTKDSDCPSGGTCSVVTRTATYCYDETYSNANTYMGYFNNKSCVGGSNNGLLCSAAADCPSGTCNTQYYSYNFASGYFTPLTTFPANSAACGTHDTVVLRANTLCLDIDVAGSQTYNFIASGNFLNWLATSKFDVEKAILTGGKYSSLYGTATNGLIPETRGCVGRKFLKQPLDQDFQNFTSSTPPQATDDINFSPTNHRLPIIFGVRGPVDTSNPSAVSQGGQAVIDIFYGNYNVAKCQAVINDYLDPNTLKTTFINDIEACISYTQTNKNTCELLQSQFCNSNADCGYFAAPAGACTVTANGSCGNFGGGVCGTQTAGTCSTVNGTCTGTNGVCAGGSKAGTACTFGDNSPCKGNGTCSKVCVGGSKAGTACGSDAICASNVKQCTTGHVGNTCTLNSDCDLKWCTNTTSTTPEKFHSSCSTNADCNAGNCTAGKASTTACLVDGDCNTALGACNAPAGAVGRACSIDANCTVVGNGQCLAPASVQVKSTYDQSMHSCYQFTFKNLGMGSSDYNIVANPSGCNQVYAQYRICNGGTNDGLQCTTLTSTPGGAGSECPSGICIGGPNAIRPGSAVLLCSTAYAGYCASTTDNWATTGGVVWLAREYADAQECVLAKFGEYCGAVTATPVTDPTNDPSNTSNYQNLPAIINDLGVEGQLGKPINSLPVGIVPASVPTGLIQDFSASIRIGAMSFDFNGSATECGVRTSTGTISPATVPAFCSNDHTRACTADTGCAGTGVCGPAVPCPYVCDSSSTNAGSPCALLPGGTTLDCIGGACVLATRNVNDLDGGHVLPNSYIGAIVSTGPNGGHTVAGVIRDIDDLPANAWTPFSEGFYNAIGYYALTSTTTTPMRLNSGDFTVPPPSPIPGVPSQVKCQKNNVLLITDGQSTADLNTTVSGLVTTNSGLLPTGAHYDTAANNSCVPFAGSRNLESLAWLAQNRNIQDMTQTPSSNSQKITTYVVYSGTGVMDDATCSSQTSTQLASLSDCQPDNLMCKTATYGGGTYYLAQDPATLKTSLKNAFLKVATSAASGTAASVLASGEGSGANLLQAIFYPARESGTDKVEWTGRLQNFWYYIDPHLGNSTIMEDSPTKDNALTLSHDSSVGFFYDSVSHQTTVTTTTPGGVVTSGVSLDNVSYLWEAGKLLFTRDLSVNPRTIYTPCSINSPQCIMIGTDNTGLMTFSTTNLHGAVQQPYLQAGSQPEADDIVNYTLGTDIAGYRNRTLTIGSDRSTWKLGDIISSTPKILSWVPLNTYYEIYNDTTYKDFTNSTDYQSRGLVFAGANDGMLHAFKLGLLGLYNDSDLKATLGKHCSSTIYKACNTDADCTPDTCTLDSDLGQEKWTFIPKNALPYLKYIADPTYCHIYSIDAQPYIFDASIGVAASSNQTPVTPPPAQDECNSTQYWNCMKAARCGSDAQCNGTNALDPVNTSWRTVLIGSMKFGGACKNMGDTCQDCTKTPMSNVGYSSYFALDITNPLSPKLLWEFSDPALGFSTSGPAIVKVVNQDFVNKRDTNGRWFAVFGSGPTGWISLNNNWAISSNYLSNAGLWSDQPNTMKLFVVDVATGSLVTTIDTGEQGAFAGSLLNATMDFDQGDISKPGNYQDDALYFGYIKGHVPFVDASITQGDARGGTATTMKLAAGSSTTNDYYKGYFIEMWQQDPVTFVWHYEGARLITGYDSTTLTVTVDSNFPVVPTGGSPWTFYNISKGWTRGGVKRLLTNQDITPANWAVSTVIDSSSLSGNTDYNTRMGGAGMGPVMSAVKKLQNYTDNSVRLFFGTGRYYYKTASRDNPTGLLDDPSNLRALYGIKEPCFLSTGSVASACITRTSGNIAGGAPTVSNIAEVDPNVQDATYHAAIGVTDTTKAGWWITLDGCRDSSNPPASVNCRTLSGVENSVAIFKPERVVSDPLAATSGAIFFSTTAPSSDPCEYGGKSYLWAVRYDTGGSLVPTGILKGKAIVQRSTSAIEQIDLATAFTDEGKMKTAASIGETSGSIAILVPPKPINRILHIQKR